MVYKNEYTIFSGYGILTRFWDAIDLAKDYQLGGDTQFKLQQVRKARALHKEMKRRLGE